MSEPQTPTGKRLAKAVWLHEPLPDIIATIEAEAIAIGAKAANEDAARWKVFASVAHSALHSGEPCSELLHDHFLDVLRLHDERVKS